MVLPLQTRLTISRKSHPQSKNKRPEKPNINPYELTSLMLLWANQTVRGLEWTTLLYEYKSLYSPTIICVTSDHFKSMLKKKNN